MGNGKWYLGEELRKPRAVDALEVGMKLNAWCYDDFYPATVKVISQKKQRTEAPVQVRFEGYGAADDAWLGVEGLKSKRLPKEKDAPKEKAKKDMDFSGLEKGMRVQAEADGKWYGAEVVTVSQGKSGSKAPVKVHWSGYTNESDEWLGADRL